MSAVRIIRMQGCKLAITGFALEIQESFGLLALRLTRLTAHWQPKPVQRVSLSKLVLTHTFKVHCGSVRNRTAMAEFTANLRAKGEK